ncbi:uncharacterized protein LOC126235424 [Schistocerca nitens]|uniref:uncharacterized protein LOC126235424 n=1 Tax=Schistocerca nitens TaxID=7011 RepID=UPI0021190562|nr:uncharacterized protein LOC126235424 [Schistocerca nitens]
MPVTQKEELQPTDGVLLCHCLESQDRLSVFDGPSPLSAAIAVLCDEASQLEVLSTGRSLFVELVARSRWPGQGFRASYHFQNDSDYNTVDAELDYLPADMEPPAVSAAIAAGSDVAPPREAVAGARNTSRARRAAILCTRGRSS